MLISSGSSETFRPSPIFRKSSLKYFSVHGPWTLLRMCVNQRLVYLQRMLDLRHGQESFERFDNAVTNKTMELMGIHLPQEQQELGNRVDALRGLPSHLSGGAVRSIASVHTRVKMLYLCRDNISRFFSKHGASERAAVVRGQWRTEALPVVTITDATDPVPANIDGDLSNPALHGHQLGNVPAANVQEDTISGDPDLETPARAPGR